jgi:quinoprotein glucose dehydrogenase
MLESGKLPASLQLDLISSAEKRGGKLSELANAWLDQLATGPAIADKYVWAMNGGNPERGKVVFYEKTAVSCVRCHRIDGTGGKVGPNLSGIGVQYDRLGVLESVVDPNKKIAVGHGQIIVATDDGMMHTGIVKEETETQLALMDPDGVVTRLDIDTIEDRKEGKSSMPEGLAEQLTRDELRDLIEYLCRRTTPVTPAGDQHE